MTVFRDRATQRRVGRKLWLARAALWWERVWPAAWPLVGAAGAFLVLALFDVLPNLPGWLHAFVLLGFAVGLLFGFLRFTRALPWPDRTAARDRLEAADDTAHRPLTTVEDKLAAGTGDPVAEGLWRAHRTRMQAHLDGLRVGWPRPGLARIDPFALRALLILLLVVAAAVGGPQLPERLARAVQPGFAVAAAETTAVEIWVTPPAHTGRAPIFLDMTTRAEAALEVPDSSIVLARVHGRGSVPDLVAGADERAFDALDGESFQAEATIGTEGRLAIVRGDQELVGWPLNLIPDLAPGIEYTLPPASSQRSMLRLDYTANDDYGVARVTALVRRLAEGADGFADGAPMEIDLPLPGVHRKEARGISYHDLTPHPWAGLPVAITLVAEDAIGQTGRTEDFETVLPARVFQHPVARAIVDLRRDLTVDPSVGNREVIAGALRDLASRPAHFYEDKVVFLALVMAAGRLNLDDRENAVAAVQDLMWDTALRIEDGELSLAERDLRQAQEALLDALANNASDEEIERLMDAVQEALERYLQAMAEVMMEGADQALEEMPVDPNAMFLQFDDLREMLNQARDLARSGARDAARDLLAQLQDMLENMQPMMLGENQDGEGSLNEMLRDLSDMIRQQQELMEETFRQWQESMQGESGAPQEYQPNFEGQQELRRSLGELMRRFGERYGDIPESLGDAEQSMRRAEDALDRALPGQAIGPQGQALDQLRQGGRAMARGQQGLAQGQEGAGDGFQRDPLGRPLPGFGRPDTENVSIPDMSDVQRAREILDELRRRAGERHRPTEELDYIDRLLQQF